MVRARPNSKILLLYLLGANLLWGTSFVATKTALVGFAPMTVMWLRMTIASLVFLPFWRRVRKPEYRKGDWRLLLLSSLFIPCLYYLFEGFALKFTTSSQAGVITAIDPLLIAVGAWLILGEKLSRRGVLGIAVSFVGVVVLSMAGDAQQAAPNPVLGNVLELFAMVAAAGSSLAVRHLTKRYDPWFLTGMQAAVGTVFFLPFALASGVAGWAGVAPIAWLSVIYLGTFVGLGAWGLYNSALSAMPASRAAITINLIPGVALLAGWALRGESLSAAQLIACAVIVGAVVFVETAPSEGEPAHVAAEPDRLDAAPELE